MARSAKKTKAIDLTRKRKGETWLEWQTRLAELTRAANDSEDPAPPPEILQHGTYQAEIVQYDNGSLCRVLRNIATSPITAMYQRGGLTDERYRAATQIAMVAEYLESSVGVRGQMIDARVDNARGNADVLLEKLSWVRMQSTYSEWRNRLPMPKRAVLDMVTVQRPLTGTARAYNWTWARARNELLDALDRWNDIMDTKADRIDEQAVARIHYRLGGGVVI